MTKRTLWRNSVLVLALIFAAGSFSAAVDDARPERQWGPEGCTVILVGKDASTDGSVISTHTADCGVCDWTFRWVPGAEHAEGATRKIYRISQYHTWPPSQGLKWERYRDDFSGLEIPQPSRTYGYYHGMFGYMNENQVAISESTTGTHRQLINSTPSAQIDLTMLTLLAMERSKTARDAIRIMGELAETYGYGFHDDGEMLAVSDPDEIWIFEIMPVGPLWSPDSGTPGAVWCAQRVPDDHVSVCPNESRIGEIDLTKPDYFMASKHVVSFAVEKKLYNPDSGKPFSWKHAYSPADTSATASGGSRARMWRFFDLAAPSKKFSPDTPNMDFPFSVKPDKKLSLQDVMNMTRDKYQGTPFDTGAGLRGGPFSNPNYHPRPVRVGDQTYPTPRPIGVNRAEYTTITQVRRGLPNEIGGILWIAFGAQDTACYMPFYLGAAEIPHSFEIGDHWEFDRGSARWAFDYVDTLAQVAYSHAIKDVQAAIEVWEGGAIERTRMIDDLALRLHKEDPAKAADFLNMYSIRNAESAVNAWWKLGDDLIVKYRGLSIYDPVKRTRIDLPYPEEWLKEVIRYHGIEPTKKK
ncbi:MAG: C69 family dipeptidase [Acidobacteriota bacterium]|nr:C69 family dipeptidase [Acidobacteriota bacterium]